MQAKTNGPGPWVIERRLTPAEASTRLREVHGIHLSPASLNRLRSVGGGPEFRKNGWWVIYDIDVLDAWAAKRLGPAQKTTHRRTKRLMEATAG